MRGPILQPPPWENAREWRGGEKGEVAGFEWLALGSEYLNDSPPAVLLRRRCTLKSPRCPVQRDDHRPGCDLDPGNFQIFPGDSNVQPGRNQCLPEVKERDESVPT